MEDNEARVFILPAPFKRVTSGWLVLNQSLRLSHTRLLHRTLNFGNYSLACLVTRLLRKYLSHLSMLGVGSVSYTCQSVILILIPCWVPKDPGMKQRRRKGSLHSKPPQGMNLSKANNS